MSSVLGYERYGAQGGDWGSMVAAKLGAAYPERIAGIHVNMLVAPPPAQPSPQDAAALERYRFWRTQEDAYSRVQRTKPDSLTIAQSDSPAGLAAWMVEKFRAWSDCAGDVERAFDRDTLLTNLMFYWAPGSAASAARIYYESARDPAGVVSRGRVEVPVGYAAFPHEILRPPRSWAEPHYAIARWTEMPRGGHFAALEAPDLLVDDIRAFFAPLR
jgi:microsomal epoxide hydrolase